MYTISPAAQAHTISIVVFSKDTGRLWPETGNGLSEVFSPVPRG